MRNLQGLTLLAEDVLWDKRPMNAYSELLVRLSRIIAPVHPAVPVSCTELTRARISPSPLKVWYRKRKLSGNGHVAEVNCLPRGGQTRHREVRRR